MKRLICTTFVCTSFFLSGAEQPGRKTSQSSSPRRGNFIVIDKEDLTKMPQLAGSRSRHQQLGDTGADTPPPPRDPLTYKSDVIKRRPSGGSEKQFNLEENFRPFWKPANNGPAPDSKS